MQIKVVRKCHTYIKDGHFSDKVCHKYIKGPLTLIKIHATLMNKKITQKVHDSLCFINCL